LQAQAVADFLGNGGLTLAGQGRVGRHGPLPYPYFWQYSKEPVEAQSPRPYSPRRAGPPGLSVSPPRNKRAEVLRVAAMKRKRSRYGNDSTRPILLKNAKTRS